jgi:hypothetical protein
MKFLENIDYNDIDKGIEFLKTHQFNFFLPENEKTIYHVYWYGTLGRKQILCINSYLATQDLKNTELWVWLDFETFKKSIKLVPKHENIKIKKYNPGTESYNTPLEGKKYLKQNKFLKFRSDLARLIFLYKYGGIYFDLDLILLKDLKPLLGVEFCYTWGAFKRGNNALIRFFKKSKNCIEVINKYKNIMINGGDHVKKFNSKFKYTIGLVHEVYSNLNIICFPSVMFDPVWNLVDLKKKSKFSSLNNFDDFFKKTNENIDFFFNNQIYAYHWHSRNNSVIEKNSFFEKIENKINKAIK